MSAAVSRRRSAISAAPLDPSALTQNKRQVYPKPKDVRKMLAKAAKRNMLFSSLDTEQLYEVADAMFSCDKKAGDVVISQGDEADNFYVVESGDVQFFVDSGNGPKAVGTAGAGGSFGELALLYGCPRAATVKVITAARLWALDRLTFQRIMMTANEGRRQNYFQFLENVPILEPLSKYNRFRVADALELISVKDGDLIIEQGAVGDAFYILEHGVASVFKNPPAGEPRVELKRLERGDYFGEIALLTDKPRAANVVAIGNCKVLRLTRDAFTRLLGECEELLRHNIIYYRRIHEAFVDEVSLFSSLTKYEKERLVEALVPKQYRQKETIIKQGSPGDTFFIIESGECLATRTESGKIAKKVLTKGDYFGEIALLTNAPRQATVTAQKPTTCLTLDRYAFQHLLGPCEEILKRNMELYKTIAASLPDQGMSGSPRVRPVSRGGAVGSSSEDTVSDLPSFQSRHPASRRRRSAISAESMSARNSEPYVKKVVPKTDMERNRIRMIIKNNILMAHLDDKQVSDLVDEFMEKNLMEGQVIIHQGEDGDNFYVIDSGEFDVYVAREGGPAEKVGSILEGGSFGELALMYGCPRAATVKAATDARVWALNRAAFRHIVVESTTRKMNDYESFLEKVPILSPLNRYERIRVADALIPMSFRDSDLILKQGEMGDAFYIMEEGEAVVYKTPAPGQAPMELKRLERGDYFGEIALLTDKPRAANVMSFGSSKVLRLDRDSFQRLLGPCEDLLQQNISHYRGIYEAFLDDVAILSSLTAAERRRVAESLQPETFRDGSVIIKQGDVGSRFYLIEKGAAVATKKNSNGQKEIVKRYTKGDYFGEIALLTNQRRKATVSAEGNTRCVYLDRDAFVSLLGPIEDILKRNMEHYSSVVAEAAH